MDDKNKNAIDIYNLIAEDYAKRFDPVDSEADLRFPNAFLSQLKPGMSIVDLGCGTGFTAGYFAKKGMVVEGVDLSSSMIAIAQRNYPALRFTVADMRDFVPAEPVDAVWAGYSLFHFEQIYLEKTLERIKSYLKPHGTLGLVLQGGTGEVEQPERFLKNRTIYIHLYTKDEMTEILSKHGFEVIASDSKPPAVGEKPFEKILLIAKLTNAKISDIV